MWTKQQSPVDAPVSSSERTAASNVTAFNTPSSSSSPSSPSSLSSPSLPSRSISPKHFGSARLGASLQIKGQISGSEDLQIDGVVDGPISLTGHELTVGQDVQLHSEIHAGEVVVYGKVVGNVHSQGRVDIKQDGSVTGDIESARISIEDGAHFKGRIEIDPAKSQSAGG